MRLVVLTGPSSCGKTTILNKVFDGIVSDRASYTDKVQEGGNPHDFSASILYRKKRIGYLTMGDYAYRVLDLLEYYNNGGYDLLITACNDRFKTPFYEFATFKECHIIRKTRQENSTQNSSDNAISQGILQLI